MATKRQRDKNVARTRELVMAILRGDDEAASVARCELRRAKVGLMLGSEMPPGEEQSDGPGDQPPRRGPRRAA